MSFILYNENCLDVLKRLEDNSVDSIVTDPPYGLTQNKKGGSGAASVNTETPYGRARIGTGNGAGGFMGMKWDSDVPSVEIWAECLRVLKPGGHLLAFAGTRTQHRMAVRIEDAGFEIRDMIAWVYGSGFPKSHDVSKALEKNVYVQAHDLQDQPNAAETWQGWGTALKPALEPITVARKPLIGTVAENVLAHGTGGLNIDGCRVEGKWNGSTRTNSPDTKQVYGDYAKVKTEQHPEGRWPANLIHDGSDEVLARFPMSGPPCGSAKKNDSGEGGVTWALKAKAGSNAAYVGDTGSTARFFYCAKASKKDREDGNVHPTVKPTDLMRYLCRLVTPPGGVVLDPFMGSGSTGKAAMLEGFQFIGCELSPEYFEIAKARIEAAKTEPTQKDMFVSSM